MVYIRSNIYKAELFDCCVDKPVCMHRLTFAFIRNKQKEHMVKYIIQERINGWIIDAIIVFILIDPAKGGTKVKQKGYLNRTVLDKAKGI